MKTTKATVASELEAHYGLEPGDLKIEGFLKAGEQWFSIYRRNIRLIDCSKDRSWENSVQESLEKKQAFDDINVTPSAIGQLERVFRPLADWWQRSDKASPTPRLSFRPLLPGEE